MHSTLLNVWCTATAVLNFTGTSVCSLKFLCGLFFTSESADIQTFRDTCRLLGSLTFLISQQCICLQDRDSVVMVDLKLPVGRLRIWSCVKCMSCVKWVS